MNRLRKQITLFLLCLLCLGVPLGAKAAVVGYSRVYQPPAITILVLGASPEVEMKVTMSQRDGETFNTLPKKETRLWENVFRINRAEVMGKSAWFGNSYDFQNSVIHIKDRGEAHSFPIPYEQLKAKDLDDYLVLDMGKKELTLGIPASRTVLLFFFHLLLYLLVEGPILYLMGVRQRRSWITVGLYTLVTKGIICFVVRHWLNVDPKMYLVFAAAALFCIMLDTAFYVMALESESRNTMGKFAGLSNFAAALAMYGAMVALPM